jgi:hypothetical protein
VSQKATIHMRFWLVVRSTSRAVAFTTKSHVNKCLLLPVIIFYFFSLKNPTVMTFFSNVMWRAQCDECSDNDCIGNNRCLCSATVRGNCLRCFVGRCFSKKKHHKVIVWLHYSSSCDNNNNDNNNNNHNNNSGANNDG